jgi:hypothetical protein
MYEATGGSVLSIIKLTQDSTYVSGVLGSNVCVLSTSEIMLFNNTFYYQE